MAGMNGRGKRAITVAGMAASQAGLFVLVMLLVYSITRC